MIAFPNKPAGFTDDPQEPDVPLKAVLELAETLFREGWHGGALGAFIEAALRLRMAALAEKKSDGGPKS